MGTWVWALMRPGMSTRPSPEITRSKAPWGRWVPTETMFFPSTTT